MLLQQTRCQPCCPSAHGAYGCLAGSCPPPADELREAAVAAGYADGPAAKEARNGRPQQQNQQQNQQVQPAQQPSSAADFPAAAANRRCSDDDGGRWCQGQADTSRQAPAARRGGAVWSSSLSRCMAGHSSRRCHCRRRCRCRGRDSRRRSSLQASGKAEAGAAKADV